MRATLAHIVAALLLIVVRGPRPATRFATWTATR